MILNKQQAFALVSDIAVSSVAVSEKTAALVELFFSLLAGGDLSMAGQGVG
jgi:hypothetical protein